MLELRLIVVAGLILIPYTHSQTSTTPIGIITNEQAAQSSAPSVLQTSQGTPEIQITTQEGKTPSQSTPQNDGTAQDQGTHQSTTISTITTVTLPFASFFECNFNSSCFGGGELSITSGFEFNPVQTDDAYNPPRAPTSDVTSITNPTNNNELCDLPYKIPGNNGTNATEWNMWFCYNNECPTPSLRNSTCASGSYGLVALNSSLPTKEVFNEINSPSVLRDSNGDQCLRFYYYFTVDNGENRGQQIQIWTRPIGAVGNLVSVQNLTIDDMKENKWQFRDVTFKPAAGAYTLVFNFVTNPSNTTDNSTFEEAIYFALDNIELYDYNCTYVQDQLSTDAPETPATTETATIPGNVTEGAPDPIPTESNLGLILGLSLGIGIPVLILAGIGGFVYVKRSREKPRAAQFDIPLKSQTSKSSNHSLRNSFAF